MGVAEVVGVAGAVETVGVTVAVATGTNPPPPNSQAFLFANALGLVAFALVGALKAIDAEFDVLGVTVAGVMTALGGGATRDVLVGRIPVALRSTTDVALALGGVGLALLLTRRADSGLMRHPAVRFPDAIGLAAFAATGALVGYDAGVSPFGVVILATITGVGGGLVSDLLLQNVPFVLKEDFYATCAVAGGAAFWIAVTLGFSTALAAVACASLVLGLRLLAMRFEWELPRI